MFPQDSYLISEFSHFTTLICNLISEEYRYSFSMDLKQIKVVKKCKTDLNVKIINMKFTAKVPVWKN